MAGKILTGILAGSIAASPILAQAEEAKQSEGVSQPVHMKMDSLLEKALAEFNINGRAWRYDGPVEQELEGSKGVVFTYRINGGELPKTQAAYDKSGFVPNIAQTLEEFGISEKDAQLGLAYMAFNLNANLSADLKASEVNGDLVMGTRADKREAFVLSDSYLKKLADAKVLDDLRKRMIVNSKNVFTVPPQGGKVFLPAEALLSWYNGPQCPEPQKEPEFEEVGSTRHELSVGPYWNLSGTKEIDGARAVWSVFPNNGKWGFALAAGGAEDRLKSDYTTEAFDADAVSGTHTFAQRTHIHEKGLYEAYGGAGFAYAPLDWLSVIVTGGPMQRAIEKGVDLSSAHYVNGDLRDIQPDPNGTDSRVFRRHGGEFDAQANFWLGNVGVGVGYTGSFFSGKYTDRISATLGVKFGGNNYRVQKTTPQTGKR